MIVFRLILVYKHTKYLEKLRGCNINSLLVAVPTPVQQCSGYDPGYYRRAEVPQVNDKIRMIFKVNTVFCATGNQSSQSWV